MNFPMWSSPLPHFYPPTNYYSYPYNTPIQTSLNSSSGYESASNETSLVDPGFPTPSLVMKESVIHQQLNYIKVDEEMEDESMSMSDNQENYYGRKKRRILSRPQRQEANRRERHRMEVINQAYEELRDVLPFKKGRKRQKMSRMDTVDGAIQYINSLRETLDGPNYNPHWAK